MSVSFIEPDLAKLREEHSHNAPHNTLPDVFHNDDEGKDPLSPIAAPVPTTASSPSLSVNYTTLSNTNSNSMLFRRMSSVSSGSDYKSECDTPRPKLNSRNLSTTSTLSSLSLSPRTSGLDNTPFRKRISFDTISTAPAAAPTTSAFKFSRPSFSSSSSSSGLLGRSKDAEEYNSFSVSCKHENHKTSYWSRSFLCSMSSVNNSRRALKWLVQNVMENGDELICLKVEHDENNEAAHYQHEAEDIMNTVVKTVDPNLEISITVEVAVGSIKNVVKKTMLLYQPALVVVGTNAKTYSNVMRYMTRKTLSNYLLNHSPVPVIVVLPHLAEKAQAEPVPSSNSVISKESISTASEDDPPQFNYLMNLINRPSLENEVDFESKPASTYKSLLTETDSLSPVDTASNQLQQVVSPDIEVVDYDDISTSKSHGSSTLSPRVSASARDHKKSSWSTKFLPKSFRKFTVDRSARSLDTGPG